MVIAIIIVVVLIIVFISIYNKKNQAPASSNLPPKPPVPKESTIPDTPVTFGYKCNWLAVYTEDTQRLANHIGLKDSAPCNWQSGVDYAYENRVFISPPVDGWSFVISARQLPFAESQETVDLLKNMLTDLSKTFTRAQYFGTYRVISYDCWIKAENGKIERAYGFVDGVNTIVEGQPSPFEKNLNLINTLSEEYKNDPNYFDREGMEYPDESLTMEMAGDWSIDPQSLDKRKDCPPALGLVGVLN
ncbi:MAG: hypothetical protein JST68_29795 [Bacteroidetes bacterium]|nr:hypothetical protein [Bacteroidota bacterium]